MSNGISSGMTAGFCIPDLSLTSCVQVKVMPKTALNVKEPGEWQQG